MFEPIRSQCTLSLPPGNIRKLYGFLMFSGDNKNGALGTNGLININNYCTHFMKLAGWQLSGVAIGWMKNFPRGNLLCENYPGGDFLGDNFPGRSFPGWDMSGWEFSWVWIVQVGIILGGNSLWWKFYGLELSVGNHPGGNFPGRSFHVTFFTDVK